MRKNQFSVYGQICENQNQKIKLPIMSKCKMKKNVKKARTEIKTLSFGNISHYNFNKALEK